MRATRSQGSLRILALDPLGKNGTKKGGRCSLYHVVVQNQGIQRESTTTWWKGNYQRQEETKIVLQGNGEFFAENVVFDGNFSIDVPSGYRCTATQGKDGSVETHLEPIESNTWEWEYRIQEGQIALQKKVFALPSVP